MFESKATRVASHSSQDEEPFRPEKVVSAKHILKYTKANLMISMSAGERPSLAFLGKAQEVSRILVAAMLCPLLCYTPSRAWGQSEKLA
jgi:hypothetical protein